MADKTTLSNARTTPGTASLSCLIAWLSRRGDFSENSVPKEFKGYRKYFNTYTQQGRANIVALSWGLPVVGMLAIYLKVRNRPVEKGEKAVQLVKS